MNTKRNYSEITPQIEKMTQLARGNNYIKPELYLQHKVNRGLRDLNGKGVLTGLTEISEIQAKEVVDGKEVSSPGKLFYRGYNICLLYTSPSPRDRTRSRMTSSA